MMPSQKPVFMSLYGDADAEWIFGDESVLYIDALRLYTVTHTCIHKMLGSVITY